MALLIVAIFVFVGTQAQPWSGVTPVGKYNQSTLTNNPATVTYGDKVTINKSMPFWVWPSLAYNPDFVTTAFDANYPTVAQITTDVVSNFAWRTGANFAGLGAVAGFTKNYVEIPFTVLGNRLIEVTETPIAGACTALPVYFGVNVIAVPTASVTGAVSALGLNNVISSVCWSAAGDNDQAINFTFPAADAALQEYPFHFNATYEVFNVSGLDGTGNLPNAAGVFDDADASVTDITGTSTVDIFGQDGATYPSASNPIIVGAGTELVALQEYPVQNNLITVYRLTYNGVNGLISRKSDYLAARAGTWAATDFGNFSYYPAVAANVAKYIISLPTPVTGPIYHISNSFAY